MDPAWLQAQVTSLGGHDHFPDWVRVSYMESVGTPLAEPMIAQRTIESFNNCHILSWP